jgi:hypothetical protein
MTSLFKDTADVALPAPARRKASAGPARRGLPRVFPHSPRAGSRCSRLAPPRPASRLARAPAYESQRLQVAREDLSPYAERPGAFTPAPRLLPRLPSAPAAAATALAGPPDAEDNSDLETAVAALAQPRALLPGVLCHRTTLSGTLNSGKVGVGRRPGPVTGVGTFSSSHACNSGSTSSTTKSQARRRAAESPKSRGVPDPSVSPRLHDFVWLTTACR